jgi:hypothetical protein
MFVKFSLHSSPFNFFSFLYLTAFSLMVAATLFLCGAGVFRRRSAKYTPDKDDKKGNDKAMYVVGPGLSKFLDNPLGLRPDGNAAALQPDDQRRGRSSGSRATVAGGGRPSGRQYRGLPPPPRTYAPPLTKAQTEFYGERHSSNSRHGSPAVSVHSTTTGAKKKDVKNSVKKAGGSPGSAHSTTTGAKPKDVKKSGKKATVVSSYGSLPVFTPITPVALSRPTFTTLPTPTSSVAPEPASGSTTVTRTNPGASSSTILLPSALPPRDPSTVFSFGPSPYHDTMPEERSDDPNDMYVD